MSGRSTAARAASVLLGDSSGAMAVEFAITFTVVLVAVLGMFEMDLIFLAQRGVDRGVVSSARWIAVNSATATASNVKTVFAAAAAPALGSAVSAGCTVSISAPTTSTSGCVVNLVFSAGSAPGSTVTVTAQYTWTPLTTMVSIGSLTMTSSAALTIQN